MVSLHEVEACRNKIQLKNLLLKKQKEYGVRLEVGGSLNYIEEAYAKIAEEEKKRAASKQKLTALEKNRMAISYV